MIITRLLTICGAFFAYGLDQLRWPDKAPSRCWLGRLTNSALDEKVLQFCLYLGPVFIKFGQIASTRPDIFGHTLSEKLAKLQDSVPECPAQVIESLLQRHWPDMPFTLHYPALGSGSIAQVHAATLTSGETVAIKVLRPGINACFKRDMSAMRWLLTLLGLFCKRFHRLRLAQLLDEFAYHLNLELDLNKEAANILTMQQNFIDEPCLCIPKLYRQYTRDNILVMQHVSGYKTSELDHLSGLERAQLAKDGIRLFFTQVMRDRFFHADMHPGNIFIDTSDAGARFITLDFGIVGTLSANDTYYLGANLLAFFARNYAEVARLHVESGWVQGQVRLEQFEHAIRGVCAPIHAMPLAEISFADLLQQLISVAEQFELIVQPQLLMLQKTLLNVEGLGRQLDPKLNLWESAYPVLWQHMQGLPSLNDSWQDLQVQWPRLKHALDRALHPQPRPRPQTSQPRWLLASLLINVLLLVYLYALAIH